jgi:hypothetical protein
MLFGAPFGGFLGSRVGGGGRGYRRLRRGFGTHGFGTQDVEEAVEKCGRLNDGLNEEEAAARVGVIGQGKEGLAECGVATEALCAADEPEVELVLDAAEVGEELGVVALGVVDEVAGVDLEELREEQARGVGEVRAGAALDLREIGLADGGFAGLFAGGVLQLDGADELLLGHGAVDATEVALDFAEITDFVCEFHGLLQIAIFISQFAIDVKSEIISVRERKPIPPKNDQIQIS